MEYELSASPVHLTTTDECILAALRKLASHEQQVKRILLKYFYFFNLKFYFKISQLLREHQSYLFDFQHRRKDVVENQENSLIDISENSCQQLIDVHKQQVNK